MIAKWGGIPLFIDLVEDTEQVAPAARAVVDFQRSGRDAGRQDALGGRGGTLVCGWRVGWMDQDGEAS